MPDFQLRHAGLDDLATLVPLFDAYRMFYQQPSDPTGARTFLRERLLLGESVIFLAKRGSEGLGFVQLYPGFSSIDLRRQWILEDLYVHPTVRRLGIAEALMHAARQHAIETGAMRLVLSTALDNLPAQALYEKLGYRLDEQFFSFALELG